MLLLFYFYKDTLQINNAYFSRYTYPLKYHLNYYYSYSNEISLNWQKTEQFWWKRNGHILLPLYWQKRIIIKLIKKYNKIVIIIYKYD